MAPWHIFPITEREDVALSSTVPFNNSASSKLVWFRALRCFGADFRKRCLTVRWLHFTTVLYVFSDLSCTCTFFDGLSRQKTLGWNHHSCVPRLPSGFGKVLMWCLCQPCLFILLWFNSVSFIFVSVFFTLDLHLSGSSFIVLMVLNCLLWRFVSF